MSTSNYFYIFVFYVNIYVSKVIVTLGNLHKKMILKCSYTDITPRRE